MGLKEDVSALLDEDLGLNDLDDEDLKKDDEQVDDPNEDQDDGKKDDKDDKEDDSDEAMETLRRSIEESHEPIAKEKKDETEDKKPAKFELNDENFFSGSVDDLEDLIKDPKGFNAILNQVYKKGAEVTHNKAVESILRSMPETIKNQVIQHITLTTATENFYRDNPDLSKYKKTVGAIATQVAAARPDLPLPKLLEVTEKLTRKKLNLIKKATENDKGGDKKGSAFPKKPSGTRSGKSKDDEPTGLKKEIGDMLSVL